MADLVQAALDAWANFQAVNATSPGSAAAWAAHDALVAANNARDGVNAPSTTAVDPQLVAQRNSVFQAISGQFSAWGLGSLSGLIQQYAQQDYTAEAAAWMLRQTPEYKQRFPAMEALAAKGRAISEAEYINYEQNAAALEVRFGIPKGMILNNVTKLLTNEVSAAELQDRATLAASDSITAPADLKQQMKDYFGVDQGGLTAYYLDPAIAMPMLEQQSAIARIGVESARQGVQTGLGMASELQGKGVTEAQAQQGFQTVAQSQGLEAGKGEVVTQDELTRGTFGSATEATKIARVAGSRVGAFSGGGDFASEKSGVTGLAAATR